MLIQLWYLADAWIIVRFMELSPNARFVLDHPWQFIRQVIAGFRANQGFLLAGAVAYYTLLSIVPMFALILVVLSQFQESAELVDTLRTYLMLVVPNQADILSNQISQFLQHWKVIGFIGFLVLLFFSSFAFSICIWMTTSRYCGFTLNSIE